MRATFVSQRAFTTLTMLTAFASGMLGCTETVRGSFPEEGGSGDAGTNGGHEDASPADAGPADDLPAPDLSDATIQCRVTPCVRELVGGNEHFCARLDDGTVRCWGDDLTPAGLEVGTLGSMPLPDGDDDGPPFGSLPMLVAGVEDIVQVSADGNDTCARDSAGAIVCWGDNSYGQLGLTAPTATYDQDPHPVPAAPSLPGAARQIEVGARSACAELTSGERWCWGNSDGEKLLRPKPSFGEPLSPGAADFPASVGVVASLRIGVNVGLARNAEGTLFSWGAYGANGSGILGRISSLPVDPLPIAVSNILGRVIDVATDGYHACAISLPDRAASSLVWCWGANAAGQLGNGVQDDRESPASVKILAEGELPVPQRVFAADRATCLRTVNGSVYCAGSNVDGRLGWPASTLASPIFKRVPDLEDVATMAVGSSSSCALLTTGEVKCWGSNRQGQLGIGSHDELPHPTPSKVEFR